MVLNLPWSDAMVFHQHAKVKRLGVRWFGCSTCDYRSYSKKWIQNHIDDMIKFERCPALYGQLGEFMHPDLKEMCEFNCPNKLECEIETLTRQIRIMEIEGKVFLQDPNIEPLMGLGRFIELYEKRKNRLEEITGNEMPRKREQRNGPVPA